MSCNCCNQPWCSQMLAFPVYIGYVICGVHVFVAILVQPCRSRMPVVPAYIEYAIAEYKWLVILVISLLFTNAGISCIPQVCDCGTLASCNSCNQLCCFRMLAIPICIERVIAEHLLKKKICWNSAEALLQFG